MKKNKRIDNIWIFLCLIALAVIIHSREAFSADFPETLFFCLSNIIYISLILFWKRSLEVKLLASGGKTYMIMAAYLMIFLITVRYSMYRLTVLETTDRYLWYSYYIPLIFIPTLFLMTGISFMNRNSWYLLIPAVILTVMVYTNDIHYFVFSRIEGAEDMIFKDHHNYEPGYYMIVIWIGLCFFTGILLLIIAVHKLKSIKKALMPFIFLAVYGILTVFLNTMSNMGIKIRLFQFPEVSVFCMMGIFEGCIRSGLIPTNNYHEELFEMMNIEAIITDRSLATHFTTRQVSDIDTDILKKAVNAPVYIDDNTRLSCNPIRAGYIFWTDDMRTIRSINDNLSRINEELEHENELKQAENDIREKNAHIAHQNRLYSMISRLMLPYEKKVEMLLDKADPLSDDFPQVVAEVSFLNAYIKRKTNLILISSGQNKISCRELYLALEESSRYFSCSGVLAQVNLTDDFMIGSDIAIVLYDTFQMILEKVYGQVSYMMTYLYDGHLRITSDFDAVPDLSDLPLKYMAGIEDNILFIDLSDELKEDLL